MKDEFVESCPYCSGREFASGVQSGYSQILGENRIFGAQTLYHVVCLGCGSVVRLRQEAEKAAHRNRKEKHSGRILINAKKKRNSEKKACIQA